MLSVGSFVLCVGGGGVLNDLEWDYEQLKTVMQERAQPSESEKEELHKLEEYIESTYESFSNTGQFFNCVGILFLLTIVARFFIKIYAKPKIEKLTNTE